MYRYFLLSKKNRKKVLKYLICIYNSQKPLNAREWREQCSDFEYPEWENNPLPHKE